MSNQRTIEVFTAECPLCTETLDLVRDAVKDCGCKVVERRCTDTVCCDDAKRRGVRAVPTIVADGAIVFEGKPSADQARAILAR